MLYPSLQGEFGWRASFCSVGHRCMAFQQMGVGRIGFRRYNLPAVWLLGNSTWQWPHGYLFSLRPIPTMTHQQMYCQDCWTHSQAPCWNIHNTWFHTWCLTHLSTGTFNSTFGATKSKQASRFYIKIWTRISHISMSRLGSSMLTPALWHEHLHHLAYKSDCSLSFYSHRRNSILDFRLLTTDRNDWREVLNKFGQHVPKPLG